MAVIFDLDQTLVDSSIAALYRDRRHWQKVYMLIPKFKKYPGIDDVLDWLNENDVPTCIVTNSPRSYCVKVLNNFGWVLDGTVCYHDTKRHKPSEEPIIKGLKILGVNPSQAISVGDHAKDIIASKRAGVFSVAASWGAEDLISLKESIPDYVCHSAKDLMKLFSKKFK
jgi:phosphoglycolate phosphatase-like HAD superfamily hydrolase